MDPLVRGALAVQQAIARSGGLALSVLLGALLVFSQVRVAQHQPISWLWLGAAGVVLALSLVVRLVRRLQRLSPEDALRLDIELFTHLLVAAFAVVVNTKQGLDGAAYPAVYVLLMLAAAFARPGATVVILAFCLGLEAAIVGFTRGTHAIYGQWGHGALMIAFASVNAFVFRAEIARVRRLSRAHIDSELDKMREAARTYRLLGPPSSGRDARGERTSVRPGSLETDEERLVRSGVEEIHQALSLALDLLRGSLRARTAVLLWLDSRGERLRIHEISTSAQNIDPGPFFAKEGLFAAAFSRGAPVSLNGSKAGRHLPYYALVPSVGAACAVPVLERGQPRGMLVVDRPEKQPFTQEEEALLHEAARFFTRSIQNERVFIQLERAKVQQGKLYRAAELLAGATTEAQVIEHGVSSAREFASFDFAAVTLFDRAQNEHEICAVSGSGADDLVGKRFRHNAGLVGMVVENHHPLPYRGQYDPKRQVVFSKRLNPPGMPSLLVLPLLVHEEALGTLVLGSSQRGAFGDDARTTLEVLASHVAVSLANARMLKRLEELATTDGLTGLLNKRALIDTAGHMIRSAARFEKPVSVLLCDIDHFKKVNDTYGHDVGDVVIKALADVLKRQKRDTDAVGRFGGEEFVVVCEETDAAGAMLLAERVRTEFEATTTHSGSVSVKCTCSVGVATFPAAGKEWEALFKATDEALYVSKRGGRNRATAWNPRLSSASAA